MMHITNGGERLHGIVLAAGEGKRLEPYVQEIRGEPLPKQYVNLIGNRSMLEETFHRAEKLIPPERLLTVISRQHLLHSEVLRQIASRPKDTIVMQPANKDTGPGILLPLMSVYKRCPDAVVAIFPSDHFVLEENRFMDHVKMAVQAVQHDASRMILLAIEPHEPEPEYGYILPHTESGKLCRFGTKRVAAFLEKPSAELAAKLVNAGALWNTMAMVFKVHTLLQLVRYVHPALYVHFCRILDALETREERRTIDKVYRNLTPINFSKQILERIAADYPRSISVLPVTNVYWSDLGSRERVLRVRRRLDQDRSGEMEAMSSSIEANGRQMNAGGHAR
jgi:mannose-1-phosphate guanylyltransferase